MVVLILGDLGYNSGFTFGGSVAIIGTIGGSYAVLTTALSYIVYKEPLTNQQKLGVGISLIGFDSLFSSVV